MVLVCLFGETLTGNDSVRGGRGAARLTRILLFARCTEPEMTAHLGYDLTIGRFGNALTAWTASLRARGAASG